MMIIKIINIVINYLLMGIFLKLFSLIVTLLIGYLYMEFTLLIARLPGGGG